MSKSFSPRPTTAFADAEAFLSKGRNKDGRPIGSNTRLRRVDENTIALIYHYTAVVTYHRNGEFTIYGGGWNSTTTKQRIRQFSPVQQLWSRPWKEGGGWIVGYTGEKTPPKVWKCRTCSGRGKWMEDDHCRPSYWGPDGYSSPWCDGSRTVYDVEFIVERDADFKKVSDNWNEHYESRREVACEHGSMERHLTRPCEHGLFEAVHVTGQSERSCYRCEGTGRADYGSKPIPIIGGASEPWVVDATGTFLRFADTTPSAPCKPSTYKPKKYLAPVTAYVPPEHHFGSEIVEKLARLIPNVHAEAKNPVTGEVGTLNGVIVDLNDAQRWSRERIADWLDTLDLDLRFPVPA